MSINDCSFWTMYYFSEILLLYKTSGLLQISRRRWMKFLKVKRNKLQKMGRNVLLVSPNLSLNLLVLLVCDTTAETKRENRDEVQKDGRKTREQGQHTQG